MTVYIYFFLSLTFKHILKHTLPVQKFSHSWPNFTKYLQYSLTVWAMPSPARPFVVWLVYGTGSWFSPLGSLRDEPRVRGTSRSHIYCPALCSCWAHFLESSWAERPRQWLQWHQLAWLLCPCGSGKVMECQV